jgi:hypothetical protein
MIVTESRRRGGSEDCNVAGGNEQEYKRITKTENNISGEN